MKNSDRTNSSSPRFKDRMSLPWTNFTESVHLVPCFTERIVPWLQVKIPWLAAPEYCDNYRSCTNPCMVGLPSDKCNSSTCNYSSCNCMAFLRCWLSICWSRFAKPSLRLWLLHQSLYSHSYCNGTDLDHMVNQPWGRCSTSFYNDLLHMCNLYADPLNFELIIIFHPCSQRLVS